jgi:hypothetical protein
VNAGISLSILTGLAIANLRQQRGKCRWWHHVCGKFFAAKAVLRTSEWQSGLIGQIYGGFNVIGLLAEIGCNLSEAGRILLSRDLCTCAVSLTFPSTARSFQPYLLSPVASKSPRFFEAAKVALRNSPHAQQVRIRRLAALPQFDLSDQLSVGRRR